MAAKKKSKVKPFLIGGAIIGGILLIPIIINRLRPAGTVPEYVPMDAGNGNGTGVSPAVAWFQAPPRRY
jgi:hypothetical protein